jgi:hypothetical protein
MRSVSPSERRDRPGHPDAAARQHTACTQTIQPAGRGGWAAMTAIRDALRRDLDQLTRTTASRAAARARWPDR